MIYKSRCIIGQFSFSTFCACGYIRVAEQVMLVFWHATCILLAGPCWIHRTRFLISAEFFCKLTSNSGLTIFGLFVTPQMYCQPDMTATSYWWCWACKFIFSPWPSPSQKVMTVMAMSVCCVEFNWLDKFPHGTKCNFCAVADNHEVMLEKYLCFQSSQLSM